MQEFIKCLKAYLKNEKINKIENDNDLINLAVEQSLQTILYPVYNDKSYKKYYIGWVVKQEEFLSIQEEITYIFNSNNINHLFTKGSVLCKYYDDPSIRTRGDIDVFVEYNNLLKAKDLLLNNGFEYHEAGPHDIHFVKNGILIELHYALFDEEIDKEWNKYFSNIFNNANKVDSYLYKLDDTYHLIYCIAHFAKHLRLGAGIRYILDFYYILSKCNIDFDRLHKELKILKLDRLYGNILNAIYYLTDISFDICNKEECNEFIDYMLKSGIHGFGKENDSDPTLGHAKKHKIRFVISRTLLTNKEYRKLKYPRLYHWYLYPICLLVNITYLLTHSIGVLFKFLFGRNKNKDLYKKLGI